jgi:hypothetical protein
MLSTTLPSPLAEETLFPPLHSLQMIPGVFPGLKVGGEISFGNLDDETFFFFEGGYCSGGFSRCSPFLVEYCSPENYRSFGSCSTGICAMKRREVKSKVKKGNITSCTDLQGLANG